VDEWAPYLMAICDGSKTLHELFRELQQRKIFSAKADPVEFAQAVSVLVSGGFIFLE
jgi:hypothetical protein